MTGSPMSECEFGVTEHGTAATFSPQRSHTVVAGATRSGKSVTTYAILAGLSAMSWVQIAGIDPSSILLAPHARDRPQQFALGTSPGAVTGAINLLDRLESEMDRRIARLAAVGIDAIPASWRDPRLPWIVVTLEEYAGFLASCTKNQRTEAVRVVGRILREGSKAGIHVLTILQRPEATILHDRAQYARRIVHRLDNADSVRMLLESASSEAIARHMNLPPGISVVHEAGAKSHLVRSDYLPYPSYARCVQTATSGKEPLWS